MMRRLSLLVLTMLYLLTTSGFALSFHYCGKLLTGFEVNAPAKSCVKIAKLKCCKDKQIKVKLKDAHQVVDFYFHAQNQTIVVPQPTFFVDFTSPVKHIPTLCFNKAPPDRLVRSVPVFIRNCTFRI